MMHSPAIPCAHCGAEFCPVLRRGRRAVHCSDACRRAWGRERAKERRPKRLEKVAPAAIPCPECNRLFVPSARRGLRFCSHACAGRYGRKLQVQQSAARRRRECAECGAAFTARHPSAAQIRAAHVQRYCSRRCASTASAAARRAAKPVS